MKSMNLKRVLVIDDEYLTRISINRALSKEGYNVDTAKNLEEAYTYLSKKTYHVALIDIYLDKELNDIHAYEVLERMRFYNEGTKPVVFSQTRKTQIPAEITENFSDIKATFIAKGIGDYTNKLLKKVSGVIPEQLNYIGHFETAAKVISGPGNSRGHYIWWLDQCKQIFNVSDKDMIKICDDICASVGPLLYPKDNEKEPTVFLDKCLEGVFWSKSIGSAIKISMVNKQENRIKELTKNIPDNTYELVDYDSVVFIIQLQKELQIDNFVKTIWENGK